MPTALAQGTRIERYRVEKAIGAGSMGDVFRGVDIDLKRKVAIKILAEKHRDNRELRARFVREARAVAAISHPNVVQVFTTGTYDDRPYIAMEFLDGTDLGTLIDEHGACSSLTAARAIRDAALGLEAAARERIIHRDVKPSNLVLLRDGHVKVTDFGLAKPVEPGDEPALTALGVVVGTPDYIAPEQARGETIDERVDIYALGGTLYFLLTAVPPFRTGRPADDKYLKVVARHLKKPAPDARVKNPQADVELARLAQVMMAKKPVDRPGYGELVEHLAQLIEHLERGGSAPREPTPRVAGTRSSGAPDRVSPTPFVGSAGPHAAPGAAGGATGGAIGGVDGGVDDAAPTRVRMLSAPVRAVNPYPTMPDDDPAAVARPQVSRWLVAVTVVSVLVFLTGLGLVLFGPMPERGSPTPAATPPDAGPQPAPRPVDAAPPPPPAPPAGMILIRKPDGSPWFFAATRPVSHRDFSALFPNHKKPSRKLADKPVTGVSYGFARAYAQSRGQRLLSAEEWQAAAADDAFVTPRDLWEWVAGPEAGADRGKKPVRSRRGGADRSSKGSRDITFRLGASL